MAADPNQQQQQQQVGLLLGQDPSHFETLISHLMSSTNEQRSHTKSLFNLCKQSHPDALAFQLSNLLQSSPRPESRTMSTILLRRQLTDIWPRLADSTRSALKSLVLTSLQTEQIKSISKKLCDIVSELASLLLPDNSWPELLLFIFHCITSDNYFGGFGV